jgi:hypothetical protein
MTTTANTVRLPHPRRRRRSGLGIFYSRFNTKELEEIRLHLKVSERISPIPSWDDTRLIAGEPWLERIHLEIGTVRAALLLISQNFLASDFIMKVEVPAIIEAAQAGLLVWCLHIRPSSVKEFPELTQFTALNNPDRPLWDLRKNQRTRELVALTETMRRYLAT